MRLTLDQTNEMFGKLYSYTGVNNYIHYLKHKGNLTAFEMEYVYKNVDKEPRPLNRVVRISKWFAEKKKAEWQTDFLPNKLYIYVYVGKTETMYHLYGVYRRSMRPIDLWIPKDFLLTNIDVDDYRNEDIDFSLYNNDKRTLKEHQCDAVKFLVNRKKCILADDMGLGKMEPVSSLIPTPDGFKRMGDIRKGDVVFSSNGKPCNVIETYPHKNKEIYEVGFTDGSSVKCGLEHLWVVKTHKWNKYKTLPLGEIMQMGIKDRDGYNKFTIPVTGAVEYAEKEYFIAPYILGLSIGDGHLKGGVTISISEDDKESAKRVKNLLNEGYSLTKYPKGRCPRYRIKSDEKHENAYSREIVRMKLNVHGDFKFIPDEYKFGSIEQRTELFRGLMDSDGSIDSGGRIRFNNNSERLVDDVCELVYSLGGIARKHYQERTRFGRTKKEFFCNIQIGINPFNLERKRKRYNPKSQTYCQRYICSVRQVENEDAQCIMVDSDDHTYITSKKYVVTHNTTTATVASIAGGFKHVLIICPASVKTTWVEELSYFVSKDDIVIVNGNKWNDAKYTIINYDILDNFYEIPTETYVAKEKVFDENGRMSYKSVEKERVSKKSDVIAKAMENSQLFQSKFDLVIVDEIHRLSNKTSGRYKIVDDLIKRSRPEGIYAITGTPLTNTPMNLYNVLKIIDADITKNWEGYVRSYCDGKQMYNKKEKDGLTRQFLNKKGKSSWYDLTFQERNELNEILDKKCKKFWITSGASNLDDLAEAIKHLYIRREKDEFNKIVDKTIEVMRYELPETLKSSYENVWNEYLSLKKENGNEKLEDYKAIIEGSVLRQWLAREMIPYTDALVQKHLKNGEKILIICCYDEELYKLQEMYGDKCVIYNGKMSQKKKDAAKKAFMEDDGVRIFIGNIQACGVGLTLVSGNVCIFNNFSWVPADNQQAMDRLHRLNQTRDVIVYYQLFKDTVFESMYDKVMGKESIISSVIHKDSEK